MTEIISFVILHYITTEETVACVESIKKLDMQEHIRIVIVDNASPNESGKILQQKYKNDLSIEVILNQENAGFSKGNNIGCLYAKQKWNPQFYVVTNNDIIFPQKDFCEKVFREYEKKEFSVMGMDIYCPTKAIHQSPLAKEVPKIQTVNKTILANKIMLKFFGILYPLIYLYYKRIDKRGFDAIDYNKYQENVCVMGACVILSGQYMDKRQTPFLPETRFYYEEFLLSLWCKIHKARVVYQPEIKVLHNEGAATKRISQRYREKVRFRIKNIVDSAEVYKKELEKI